MSNLLPGNGVRDKYVKDSGNNDNDGSNVIFPVADLPTVVSRINALVPPPGLFNPAGIVDIGISRYSLSETLTITDNVQAALRFCTVATANDWTAGATMLNAPANAQVSLLTITTSAGSGDVAYSTNGKSRVSLDARAIILNGPDQIGSNITGATDDSFQDVGQAAARFGDSTLLNIESTGNQPRYYAYNEMNVEGDNCIAFNCNTTASTVAAFRVGAITYESGLTGTGAGCVAFNIVNGLMSGYCVEANIETVANIESGGDLVLNGVNMTGAIINDGSLNYSAHSSSGDFTNSGESISNIDNHTGNLTNSGTSNYRAVKLTGDITNSGTLTATIDDHTGSIINSGILNGMINGVRYGTWVNGTEYLSDFFESGNINLAYSKFGFLQIDATTPTPDTVDSIIVRYQQNTSASRTIDFQLVDDDDGTVYFSGTNTDTGIEAKIFEVPTVVNPLPNRVVNLAAQIKDNGGAVVDAGVNIYYTRNN